MRFVPLSTCEQNFLLQSFIENHRVDGRKCDEYRELEILFGLEDGSCLTCLGNTKVFTQVSAELCEPKGSRPNEGTVYVNVEMSPMAAPNFEVGRLGDRGVELCRVLERLIKESGCVDTESLCIKAGTQAWQIRVDVHVLDYCGSLVDCASVSAITALGHFRRPDVSVVGDQVQVHSLNEREPVPLNLYHYPICTTFGFTENGSCSIVDPNDKEEQVLEGCVVVGANKRQELCTLHCSGAMTVTKALILRCTNRAMQRAAVVVDKIREKLAIEKENRSKGSVQGFDQSISSLPLSAHCRPEKSVQNLTLMECQQGTSVEPGSESVPVERNGSAVHVGKGASPLMTETETNDDDVQIIAEITNAVRTTIMNDDIELIETNETKRSSKDRKRTAAAQERKRKDDVAQLLDDIEDDVVVLEPDALGYESKRTKTPDDSNVDLTTALRSKEGRSKRKAKSQKK